MNWLEKVRKWHFDYGFILMGLVVILLIAVNALALSGDNGEIITKEMVGGGIPFPMERKEDNQEINEDGCNEECVKKLISEALVELEVEKSLSVTPTPTSTKVIAKTPTTSLPSQLSVETVRLGDGSGSGSEWVNVGSGTWINTSLYGQLESATWSGWALIPGGSGIARIRLYDATNNRVVDGSEVMIKDVSETSFYSGNLSIWRGQNQYFVQVKSESGESVGVKEATMKLTVR